MRRRCSHAAKVLCALRSPADQQLIRAPSRSVSLPYRMTCPLSLDFHGCLERRTVGIRSDQMSVSNVIFKPHELEIRIGPLNFPEIVLRDLWKSSNALL